MLKQESVAEQPFWIKSIVGPILAVITGMIIVILDNAVLIKLPAASCGELH